ncbi:hypothetical protein MHM98_05920 [Psychrobium sp. MM17-31]|uniref:hypothetical protein n=1 Tax=Psychrobium sp. MM17-31 TaxID=2917758 RepID=UPI001EF74A0C|nr:hypothetical protein [Psychrobium sp. MM17-31]MCG7530893.1 hypothetical protein [Psychrobium sp. MM17-31]
MITKIFLIPIILCILWALYLNAKGWKLSQGKQGFKWILGIGAGIGLFYTIMLWLVSP